MMCERFREQIPEVLAGRLDKASRDRLMAHLETCAGCRAQLAELNAVWRGLESLPESEPDRAMRTRFLETLQAYQAGLEAGREMPRPAAAPASAPAKGWWPLRPVWQSALACAVLIVGVVAGRYAATLAANENPEVSQLRGQVESLRQLVTLSLLQEPSPSARLRGVTYSYQMAQPDAQVEQALLYVVNHDSNVNVRLSAVDALGKYAGNPDVRRALVDALPVQDSPLVQIALIDMLAQLHEQGAVPALQKLAKDTQANDAVRQRAADIASRMEATR